MSQMRDLSRRSLEKYHGKGLCYLFQDRSLPRRYQTKFIFSHISMTSGCLHMHVQHIGRKRWSLWQSAETDIQKFTVLMQLLPWMASLSVNRRRHSGQTLAAHWVGCMVMHQGDLAPVPDPATYFLSVLRQATYSKSQFNSNEDVYLHGRRAVRTFGKRRQVSRC